MFSKLLAAVDGSEISRKAFDQALDIAKRNNAELHVIYVIETGFTSPNPIDSNWELIYQVFETEGNRLLDELAEEAKKKGVKLITHMETGHAGERIVKKSAELGCDLIVIGSLGKSKLDRLLLGSVSSYVVNYGKANTIIIRK
ncbi:MAG TPA: universal stress protein [Methanocorpusculum sp.]|nr:universal stress protein [Methanocorpusculum sp.]